VLREACQTHRNGIGITARDRKHLFGRYFRGSNATGIAGNGVGLHLVAMVVNLHKGEGFCRELGRGRIPIHGSFAPIIHHCHARTGARPSS
jgi:signal transduction histidine kinase